MQLVKLTENMRTIWCTWFFWCNCFGKYALVSTPYNLCFSPIQVLNDGLTAVHVPYSYGFAIIFLTVLVKVTTFPLTKQQVGVSLSCIPPLMLTKLSANDALPMGKLFQDWLTYSCIFLIAGPMVWPLHDVCQSCLSGWDIVSDALGSLSSMG